MNQTWKNGKKNLVLNPILVHMAQIRATKIFLRKFVFLNH